MTIGLKFRRDRTNYVAKTKAMISFAVTAKLICVFVFAYAKRWFSHDSALIIFFFFALFLLVMTYCMMWKLYFSFQLLTVSGNLAYIGSDAWKAANGS